MADFRRLFLSILIAFLLIFPTPSARSLPLLIAQNPSSEFLNLGVDMMRRGNYNKAIENFNQAIQHQQDFAIAYSDRCLAYLQLQDYQQAIADCTQAINLATDNVEAYLNRGLAHYRQGDYQVAIANYNQAIALKPDDFRAYYNRGLACAGEGNYPEAIVNYNLAITQIPQKINLPLANIYNDRGLVRLELQDFAAAMLDFDMAIRLNPQDDRAYFNRACICGRNGDDFGAVRDFSEVIRLNTSNAQAYVNRGVARYHLGYHQKSVEALLLVVRHR
jgi:tetratricopeptide (TPR) repeat protein